MSLGLQTIDVLRLQQPIHSFVTEKRKKMAISEGICDGSLQFKFRHMSVVVFFQGRLRIVTLIHHCVY